MFQLLNNYIIYFLLFQIITVFSCKSSHNTPPEQHPVATHALQPEVLLPTTSATQQNSQAMPIQGDNPKSIQLGKEDDNENEAPLQTHKENKAEERQNENKEGVTSNDSNLEQTGKNRASLVETKENGQIPKGVVASGSRQISATSSSPKKRSSIVGRFLKLSPKKSTKNSSTSNSTFFE